MERAEAGEALAQCEVGDRYRDAEGVEEDFGLALECGVAINCP